MAIIGQMFASDRGSLYFNALAGDDFLPCNTQKTESGKILLYVTQ